MERSGRKVSAGVQACGAEQGSERPCDAARRPESPHGFHADGFLETNTGLSSDEILRRASSAEAFAPFRQRFLYNNVHYLAAGSAAAAAAGTSWAALMKARILAPLGMAATRTSLREAWKDPRVARGYAWDEARKTFRLVTLETLGNNIDGIAPAGAISSTALDMTSWLRFLLRQGVQDGKALIDPAALTTTWTPQIPIGGTIGYGMGWFVRTWQGQRLIEHGGAIAGYSAEVGLLPDSNIGFVVLTNTLSALPSIAMQLVPQYPLGELPPAASNVGDLKPYLGRYIANFATFSNEVFTISERNRRLVLDIPSQVESALNPPRADGRWSLVKSDQTAVSFDRDKTGRGGGAEDARGRPGVRGAHAKASCSRRRSRSASCRSMWAAMATRPARTNFADPHPESAARRPAAKQHIVRPPSTRRRPGAGRPARTWGSASRSRNRRRGPCPP